MTGADAILSAIDRSADEEARALAARAGEEARALVEAAAAAARRLEEASGRSAGEREALPLARRALSDARRSAADLVRDALEEEVGAALAAARAELAAIGAARESARWRALLGALLDEALALLPEATRLEADERDAASVARLLRDRGRQVTIAAPPGGAALDGVIVSDGAGRLVRATLAERLSRALPEARRLAAAAIRGPAPAPAGGVP